MIDKAKALEAVTVLHRLYSKAATTLLQPRGLFIEYEDREAFRKDRTEAEKQAFRDSVELRKARERLLASGYDAPDSWLTVNPILLVDYKEDAEGFMGLAYRLEDRKAVIAVCRELDAAIMRLTMKPEAGAKAPDPTQPAVDAQPKARLFSWREILAALGVASGDESRRRIKRLNELRQGPIRTKGKGSQPQVERGALIEWWNRLEIEAEDQANRREGRRLESEAQYAYGRNGTVAPEIGGTIRARRRGKEA